MRINLERARIEFVVGDIVEQDDVQAVVNAANAELLPGGGVAGAIHKKAGPELAAACRPFAPIAPGEAVITEAFALPNMFVIHCLGPVYGVDQPEAQLLARCYRAAITLAEAKEIESIAIPAISTGAFGYPIAEAASVACEAVVSALQDCVTVRLVRHVLRKDSQVRLFGDQTLKAIGRLHTH
jgi:O-acetyl-ADP-ribose deacetylase (regulator of RNase III)